MNFGRDTRLHLCRKYAYRHIILRPLPNVLHIHFKDKGEAAIVLLRIYEFGKSYSRSTSFAHMMANARRHGSHIMSNRLGGVHFNGRTIADKVLPALAPLLSFEEVILHNEMKHFSGEFSLIATWGTDFRRHLGSTIRHEIAHALWLQFPAYRKTARRIMSSLPNSVKKAMLFELMERDYVDYDVPFSKQADNLINEMQAFTIAPSVWRYHDDCFIDDCDGTLTLQEYSWKLASITPRYCRMIDDLYSIGVKRWRTLCDTRQRAHYSLFNAGTRTSAAAQTLQEDVFAYERDESSLVA